MYKNATIRHEGKKWVLYDSAGKKVLGRHDSKASAERQERAIQASKHAYALGVKTAGVWNQGLLPSENRLLDALKWLGLTAGSGAGAGALGSALVGESPTEGALYGGVLGLGGGLGSMGGAAGLRALSKKLQGRPLRPLYGDVGFEGIPEFMSGSLAGTHLGIEAADKLWDRLHPDEDEEE